MAAASPSVDVSSFEPRYQYSEICLHTLFWCPVATNVVRLRYGQGFATCILLAPRFACKHGLVALPSVPCGPLQLQQHMRHYPSSGMGRTI